MVSKGTSSGKYTRNNILRALFYTCTNKGVLAVFIVFTVLTGSFILGHASTAGPTIPVGPNVGFYDFYSNGTYSFVVYSYDSNGTPRAAENVKMVLTNTTTEKTLSVTGTIASDGLAVLNLTSNQSWLAGLYVFGQQGYQPSGGYTVTPHSVRTPFVSDLTIFDRGHLNEAGFVIFYVSPQGGSAPYMDYRVNYSPVSSIQYSVVTGDPNSSTSIESDATPSDYNGSINLGSLGGFEFKIIYVNYASIPANLIYISGGLQYDNGGKWSYVSSRSGSDGTSVLLLKITQSYIEPKAYSLFLGIDALFVALFGVLLSITVFGYPRSSRSLELLLSKPLTRLDTIAARYLSVISILAISSAIDILVFDLLIGYFLGIYLSIYASAVIFASTLLIGGIFASFTFLFSSLWKGMISVIVAPAGWLFFLYYAYLPLVQGIVYVLGTLGVYPTNYVQSAIENIAPFQLASVIVSLHNREPGALGFYIGFPFNKVPFLMLFMLLWCVIPLILAGIRWRRIDA